MPTWEKKGDGSTLIIRPHQGMGDHIICCGMYRHFAKDREVIVLAHSGRVADNVAFMLSDLPNVCVVDYPDDRTMDESLAAETNCEILRLGAAAGEPHFDRWKFDREFYRQANVPFWFRWDKFACPECPQYTLGLKDWKFVHQRIDLNAIIKPLPEGIVGFPNHLYTVFQHRDMILHAQELHCVSSAFAAFADCFDLKDKPLYFYPFGREIPHHQNPWFHR